MINLPNGHSFTFCCASGALGFDGRGYFWERPLHWLGMLRHPELTVITKTLTLEPRKGNLNMWCPWRCVRLINGGAVNAVGLSNPGLDYWEKYHYQKVCKSRPIVSIMAASAAEVVAMATRLNPLHLAAIEINVSCPNTDDNCNPIKIVEAARQVSTHPIIAKLGMAELQLIKELEPHVDAFDLINSVPWYGVFPRRPSPLAGYNLHGGVSGSPIKNFARRGLDFARRQTAKPIIAGGGIMDCDEVFVRQSMGADAFSLGTIFLRQPWKPSQIIREYHRRHTSQQVHITSNQPFKETL